MRVVAKRGGVRRVDRECFLIQGARFLAPPTLVEEARVVDELCMRQAGAQASTGGARTPGPGNCTACMRERARARRRAERAGATALPRARQRAQDPGSRWTHRAHVHRTQREALAVANLCLLAAPLLRHAVGQPAEDGLHVLGFAGPQREHLLGFAQERGQALELGRMRIFPGHPPLPKAQG